MEGGETRASTNKRIATQRLTASYQKKHIPEATAATAITASSSQPDTEWQRQKRALVYCTIIYNINSIINRRVQFIRNYGYQRRVLG